MVTAVKKRIGSRANPVFFKPAVGRHGGRAVWCCGKRISQWEPFVPKLCTLEVANQDRGNRANLRHLITQPHMAQILWKKMEIILFTFQMRFSQNQCTKWIKRGSKMCLVVFLNDSTVQNFENMIDRAQIWMAKIRSQVEVRIPPLFALFSTHFWSKSPEKLI